MDFLKENEPIWDLGKERIIRQSPQGTFDLHTVIGGSLGQEWYKLINDGGVTVAFGWLDIRGDRIEVSLAVDQAYSKLGYGSLIINEMELRAKEMGFNLLAAIVKVTNPSSLRMIKWLYQKGYKVYIPGFNGNEPQSEGIAINMARRMDVELTKHFS
jgi:GNAT superfamily N-acetyltransferase